MLSFDFALLALTSWLVCIVLLFASGMKFEYSDFKEALVSCDNVNCTIIIRARRSSAFDDNRQFLSTHIQPVMNGNEGSVVQLHVRMVIPAHKVVGYLDYFAMLAKICNEMNPSESHIWLNWS